VFAHLADLQQQTQGLRSQRQDGSSQQLEAGFAALNAAMASTFQDKELLEQAFTAFNKAAQLNRRNADPLVAMGYLYLVLDDRMMALKYFQSARSTDPTHPDPPRFLELLQSLNRPTPTAEEIDYDALYDQAEAHLHAMMRQVTRIEPAPAQADPQLLSQLKAQCMELQTEHQRLNALLQRLEAEFDTASLHQRLRPLAMAQQSLEQRVQLSQTLVKLAQDLGVWLEMAQQMLASPPEASQLGPAVEDLLDNCDRFADQLEVLERSPADVSGPLALYQRLTETVEALQDLLED
jgi:tetratricopeptide (TPR) repeat protein